MFRSGKRSIGASRRGERDGEGEGAIEELIRPHNLSGYESGRQH